ncbi:MAG: hypothetical protein ABI462_01875 [Ignavibacteria bacterium]
MKRIKIPVKKKRTNKESYEKYNFEKNFKPGKILKIIFYSLVIILPIILALNYLRFSYRQNGVLSFPLDDPWIHLTFAKNLAHYFSFSYFKNEMVTAGSTSPLYTFIVSAMFLIKSNEMYISFALGIGFFSAACYSFFKLAIIEFNKEIIFALLCTGILIMDKWINLIADSGMETTMYIFILILCVYFYKSRKAIPFAILLGLVMWARPDGLVFIIAVIIDYILVKIYSKNQFSLKLFSQSDLKKIAIIFLGLLGLYFLFNYMLSGSLLPNTYNAKLAYYSPETRSRWDFLRFEVWAYFKYGSYYVVMIGFIFTFLKFIYDIYKKTYNQNTIYILFGLALVFIYFMKLPYAHRFGRYMMPIIPFFILAAVIGFRDLARIINKYTTNELFAKSLFYILIGIVYFMGIGNYEETKELYAANCKYIYDRQVTAAKWLQQYTNENDVIATHDVGAIGYYSNRKIVDVAGLVTPDLINKIGDIDYVKYMQQYMKDKGVTYLAFIREYNRVSNQAPLLQTPDNISPEIMEVFKYHPDTTEILSKEGNSLIMNLETLASQKASQQLIYVSRRMLEVEPRSSYAYYLIAYAYQLLEDEVNYEKSMRKAIELYPDFKEAHFYYGVHLRETGRNEEARQQFMKVLVLDPNHQQAKTNLKLVEDALLQAQTGEPKSLYK